MKSTILLLSTLLALPVFGQTYQPRQPQPRVVPPPGMPQQGSQPSSERLQKNTTIRVQGTTTTGQEIDFSLTGVGPQFHADQTIGANDTVLTCEYLVKESDEGFVVSYALGFRLKIASGGSSTYEFRDVSVNGNVLCKPGEPVVIVKNGEKTLQLTVSQETEKPKK